MLTWPAERGKRELYGTGSYLSNAKSILPYSFSIKLSSVSAGMDTTQQWQTVDRIQKTVENYFASECVQQVVIYDVRHTNNDMIVDITVGTVF